MIDEKQMESLKRSMDYAMGIILAIFALNAIALICHYRTKRYEFLVEGQRGGGMILMSDAEAGAYVREGYQIRLLKPLSSK